MRSSFAILTLMLLGGAIAAATAAENYSWQQPHVTILPNGDLEWKPEPYRFTAEGEVRYIDYEGGDDAASGTNPGAAWRHHPWDTQATGQAAQAEGPITYVFKGGVAYRGQLVADESGQPGKPIRLVADPDWGDGAPLFYGSEPLTGAWVRADAVAHPPRLPEPDRVWALDLSDTPFVDHKNRFQFQQLGSDKTSSFNPTFYALHLRDGDDWRTLHLARSPDWQPGSDNFMLDYWHQTGPDAELQGRGKTINAGFVDQQWAGKDLSEDYFTGGYIWSMTRTLIATATPHEIPAEFNHKKLKGSVPWFDPERGILRHTNRGRTFGKGGVRYMIENLPQFLDTADEFYLDSDSGVLYLRLPEGEDPNQGHIELTTDAGQIQIHSRSHIEIAGLHFSFATKNTIDIENSATHIDIHHCTFAHVLDNAIRAELALDPEVDHVMDHIRIADCSFTDIGTTAIKASGTYPWGKPDAGYRGRFRRIDILRNRTFNTGIRHHDNTWSNVPAINAQQIYFGEIAGNIVRRSLGSGIVIMGGKSGSIGRYEGRSLDIPHIRILVHHNKTEDTALGVSDYGGLALWQGGPIYAYCNIVGNSPGHNPGGFFAKQGPFNLSYPIYLDGSFKMYCFNNIVWGRSTDPKDPFSNTTAGYFSVFGFLNQFTNNTVYRNAKGVGGSSGNRNDIVSNIFADISEKFLANNREGDPSLVGGGDDASSGLRGVPSLAFAHNLFHGQAQAGTILQAEGKRREQVFDQPIDAADIATMREQMQAFPIRVPDLGVATEKSPIIGAPAGPIDELTSEVDFRPRPGSPAVDAGGLYFVPWSLAGTVGEWQFTENHADPGLISDYHWCMDEMHFTRAMYEYVPSFDLQVASATLDDYVSGPTEDWVRSALRFDGERVAVAADAPMREDFRLGAHKWGGRKIDADDLPGEPWQREGEQVVYPAAKRNTPIITTQNLLLEAVFRSEQPGGRLIAKYDGSNGYKLEIDEAGKGRFVLAGGGTTAAVSTDQAVADGEWHHLLAEVDRASGRMTIYLDGAVAGESQGGLAAGVSIDTQADLEVGAGLVGAIDFLRICRGTLADAQTDIAELHTWQTDGPFRYDYAGQAPQGRRDAGAFEATP